VAKPSRTHSYTALVNHTRQHRQRGSRLGSSGVDREAQARRCGYESQSSVANFITKPMGPNASNTRIGVLSRGRISACVHKRHSEQSCAGVPDEGFGVAAVGLEHLERLMPTTLHGAGDEAGPEAMAILP
jgi:hypothetical protein